MKIQKFLSTFVERVVKNDYFVTTVNKKRGVAFNHASLYSVNQRIKPVESVVLSDA